MSDIEFTKKPRGRNIYSPDSGAPFKLSRSKIEDFVRCPRCFYLDRRLGVGQPSIPGYTLNVAVDELLKKEFDGYRALQEPHPLLVQHGLNLIPFQHESLNDWRHNFRGVQFHHEPSGFLITGAVDDVWHDNKGTLYVVDYKATSINGGLVAETQLRVSYQRQVELYQWLLRQNGFTVSRTAYFVYANGIKSRDDFGGRLEFDISLFDHVGSDKWVEPTLSQISLCLSAETPPPARAECEYCAYRHHANDALGGP